MGVFSGLAVFGLAENKQLVEPFYLLGTGRNDQDLLASFCDLQLNLRLLLLGAGPKRFE